MKKVYRVKFYKPDKTSYIFEFTTDDVIKSIDEYCRNREISRYEILTEDQETSRQMLFG